MARLEPSHATRGFTLIEVLVSLVLLMLAFALAAQLLMETSQMLADASGEQIESPVPLAVARLRGDVLGSSSFTVVADPDGGPPRLLLEGHPSGAVLYERDGTEIHRLLLDDAGKPGAESVLLRGVTSWQCMAVAPRLLRVDLRYRRRGQRPSPLPGLPAFRAPETEERTESLLLVPRGAGLGESW
jgi:prepilin-type N-terminal cleavage/methylation domain-containing protein